MFKTLFATAVIASTALMGCTDTVTPDTNTHVFRTEDEVAAARRAHQQRIWKEAALEVLREERPDITAQGEDGLAIVISADGARERLDLSPLAPDLTSQPHQLHPIVRDHLLKQLIPFDQQRLARMSFESVRPRIRPMLLNGHQLGELNTHLSAQLPSRTIFADLYWIPVARWDASAGARPPTPIGPKLLASWNIPPEQLERLALSNVAADPVENSFEITSFGTLGKIGTLKPGVDPAILLSPNFLPTARQALGSSDSLALLLTTPQDIRFLESQNKRLLDSLYPQWKLLVTNNRKALATRPLLLSEQGISNLNYAPPVNLIRPASMPSTNPLRDLINRGPATRPTRPKPSTRPYIVR